MHGNVWAGFQCSEPQDSDAENKIDTKTSMCSDTQYERGKTAASSWF